MEKGDAVPEFRLPDEKGVMRTLSGLLSQGALVLFFYPAASSRGCSVETRHFQELVGDFAAVDAHVVGISTDQVRKQFAFASACGLDFPLLSDAEGTVATAFGVKRRFGPIPVKRWTFVLDTDRRVLEVVKSELRMEAHADRALETLRLRASA